MTERWWINGHPGRAVDVADRGLAYGDGLFETLAIRQGHPRFLELHLDRLLTGCHRLGIPPPPRGALATMLREKAGLISHGTLKLILTRGQGERGYAPPGRPRPTLILGLLPAPRREQAAGHPQLAGVQVRLCSQRVSRNATTAGLKTLNRLDQVLARAEWTDPAVAEGLMMDETGLVVGGTMSNVFLERNGALVTPRLDQAGVAGVMRRVVLETAARHGLPAREGRLTPGDLVQAEGIFLCNALRGLRPVVTLTGVPVARRLGIGSVTRQLAEALEQDFGVGPWDGG